MISSAKMFSEEDLRYIHSILISTLGVLPETQGGHWVWRTGKKPPELWDINLKRASWSIWRGTPEGDVWRVCGLDNCLNPSHMEDRKKET